MWPYSIQFVPILIAIATSANGIPHDWTAPIPQYVIDLFEPLEFRYSGESFQDRTFNYRLFIPKELDSDEDYPLLLWTSGYGEKGNDNFGQLMHLEHVFPDNSRIDLYRFFVLAMQNPADAPTWVDHYGVPSPDEPATVLMAILDHVMQEYPIDQNRIYISGVSAGGTACWEIALRYPERFAAIVPMASSGADHNVERLKRLVDIPIWAFHCREDPSSSPDSVRMTVGVLERLGAKVHLTEIDAKSHDCWTPAFRDYGAMDWMLAQVRGTKSIPPGVRPWGFWNYLVIVGVPLLFWMAIRSERKRRRTVKEGQHHYLLEACAR